MREKEREREERERLWYSPLLRKRFCTPILLIRGDKPKSSLQIIPPLSPSTLTFLSLMRIRKRPMVAFFPISPPPQTPPDLPQQYKDEILQKSPTPKQKLEEEEEEEKGEDHRAEAKERRSGTDPTTHHSKDPSNGWVPFEQMKKKRCCMFSTPIPKQVEVEVGISNNHSFISTFYFPPIIKPNVLPNKTHKRNLAPFPCKPSNQKV